MESDVILMTDTSHLSFFGIGSNSFHDLSTVSFAIETEDAWTLVDCGPTTPRDIYSTGFSFLDIDTVILTHRHPDHCLGTSYFMFGRHLEVIGKQKEEEGYTPSSLTIICEDEVEEFVEHAFEFCHGGITRSYDVEFKDIQKYKTPTDLTDSIKITAIEVDHSVPTYGFLLKQDDSNWIAYSSDTLLQESFIETVAGSDVLIHEAMVPSSMSKFAKKTKHATAAMAGKAIDQVEPDQAYLVHLRPSFSGDRGELEREAGELCNLDPVYPEERTIVELG